MPAREGAGDDEIAEGDRFASFAFEDVPVNVLTGGGYDPVTQTAALKACPVALKAVGAPPGVGQAGPLVGLGRV